MIEIKHKETGAVLLTLAADCLAGENLDHSHLVGADLQGADLTGANLQGADLDNADLRGANFRAAMLRGADLSGADLSGATFGDGVQSNAAVLSGCSLRDARVTSCDMPYVDLRDAGIGLEDIKDVVMVGGSTRVPRVRELVGDFFGAPPLVDIDPDRVVAIGAAIQADILVGNRPEGDLRAIAMVCVIALLIHPALTWTIGKFLTLPNDLFRSGVLTAAMAPGFNAYIFANMYGVETERFGDSTGPLAGI